MVDSLVEWSAAVHATPLHRRYERVWSPHRAVSGIYASRGNDRSGSCSAVERGAARSLPAEGLGDADEVEDSRHRHHERRDYAQRQYVSQCDVVADAIL